MDEMTTPAELEHQRIAEEERAARAITEYALPGVPHLALPRRGALIDSFIPHIVPSFATYAAYEKPI